MTVRLHSHYAAAPDLPWALLRGVSGHTDPHPVRANVVTLAGTRLDQEASL